MKKTAAPGSLIVSDCAWAYSWLKDLGASGKQLQPYLDEFAFRFNRRNSALRGQLFYRLVQRHGFYPCNPAF